MHIIISKEALLKPLTLVSGAIERKHTLPILSNVLIETSLEEVKMTGTDMEVELIAATQAGNVIQAGAITVPAKKLFDICRSLPDGSEIEFKVKAIQRSLNLVRVVSVYRHYLQVIILI